MLVLYVVVKFSGRIKMDEWNQDQCNYLAIMWNRGLWNWPRVHLDYHSSYNLGKCPSDDWNIDYDFRNCSDVSRNIQ